MTEPGRFVPQPMPSVYRARSVVLRRRVLFGLAGVAMLLIGYLIGRWQDTPAGIPPVVAPASIAAPGASTPAIQAPSPTPSAADYPTLQAEAASALNGIQVENTADAGGGKDVGWIANGDSMRFDGLDFGDVPAVALDVRMAALTSPGGRMEVHLDRPDQAPIGVLNVLPTGGWQTWRTVGVPLTPVTGVHTVFLTFVRGDGAEFVNINWLRFTH